MDAQPLGDDLVDRLARVQAPARILEDQLSLVVVRFSRLRSSRSVALEGATAPSLDGCSPRIVRASVVLPHTALADESDDLARAQFEVDAVDGEDLAAAAMPRRIGDLTPSTSSSGSLTA